MCAINGFNFKDEALIKKMNAATAHRGPDGSGIFVDDAITLGHDRLSILDLSRAADQPMKSADGRLVIVFNGEIYNYRELKEELKSSYPFRTTSDTEVILAAYAKWGKECVKKFNGIFAFAIWDAAKKELFLARDHAGVKPLYYFWHPSTGSLLQQASGGQAGQARFIFSSEIKAILAHDVPRAVSREAFNFYFHLYYVPEPLTMFQGIMKLPAASRAVFSNGKLTIEKYWEVTDFSLFSTKINPSPYGYSLYKRENSARNSSFFKGGARRAEDFSDVVSRGDVRQEIRRLFDDSVKHQLISDRPVGVFLSGGMDSTAVLGSVVAASGKAQTFSVGFDVGVEREKFNADALLAKKTAAHYGAEHHELVIGARDIGDNLERIAWHLDEPNFNPTAGAMYLLSKMAKEKVAVVLGGDGGDELFGGYPRYWYSRLISVFQRLPFNSALAGLFGKNNAQKLRLPPDASRVVAFLAEKEENVAGVLVSGLSDADAIVRHFAERYFSSTEPQDFEKRFMNIDRQSWLRDESLMRSDKMTMSHGLECRVPMLDYRLVELAAKIPTQWKFSLFQGKPFGFAQGKRIWREAIADYLPPHVLHEQKRGWFTPMAKWMRGELKNKVQGILAELPPEYFNRDEALRMFRAHVASERYNLNMLWALVMWELWYEQFIRRG